MESDLKEFLRILNPRSNLPNISASIELHRNEKYGRMIVSKENLSPGDVIAVEEPFFLSLDKSSENQQRCGCCLRTLTNKITCLGCSSISFCSTSCQTKHWNNYHKFECEHFEEIDSDDNYLLLMNRMLFKSIAVCGSLSNLNLLIESVDNMLTIFTTCCNSKSIEKVILVCCFNLECGNVKDDFEFIDYCIDSPFLKQFVQTEKEEAIMKNIILKILGILNRNSFTVSYKGTRAGAIYPFGSLINHSCSPNVDKINFGSKSVYVCNQPIAKNNQLFLCYRRPFYYDPKSKRERSLYRQFNFQCECPACSDEKYSQILYDIVPDVQQQKSFTDYKANCRFITENFHLYPSFELIHAIRSNKKFLQIVLDEY